MANDSEDEKRGASDVISLVTRYFKQETIEPLRGILRFLGFGLAAAMFIGIGSLLLLLAMLRALQSETGTTFQGNWSWAPYLLTLAAAAVIAGLAASAIGKVKRRSRRRRASRA